MLHIEKVKRAAVKYNWYFKERRVMIRILLVPDFQLDNAVPIFGILAFTFLLQATMRDKLWKYHPYKSVGLAGLWSFQTK